jgi:putative sterol carrier protein
MSLHSEQAFEKIRAALTRLDPDPNNRLVLRVFKINIKKNGSIAKTMILDLIKLKFYEGAAESDFIITVEDKLFNDIVNRDASALAAFADGELEIEADAEVIEAVKEKIANVINWLYEEVED